jgi:hypothetical protein
MLNKALLAVILILSGCATIHPDDTKFDPKYSTAFYYRPGPHTACPGPVAPVKPLPKIRDSNELATYANDLQDALDKSEHNREVCAKSLQRLKGQ